MSNTQGPFDGAKPLYAPIRDLRDYRVARQIETSLDIFLEYQDRDNDIYSSVLCRAPDQQAISIAIQILQLAQGNLDSQTVEALQEIVESFEQSDGS